MLTKPEEPRIPLPKGWQGCVKTAVLHAIALAHYAIVYARAWAADSINAWVRLAAENGGNTAWIVFGYKCNQRTMEPGRGSCSRVWPTAG